MAVKAADDYAAIGLRLREIEAEKLVGIGGTPAHAHRDPGVTMRLLRVTPLRVTP
jgi:hypothetical protein